MKRLPRKKKKEFKKRDPELYRVMHIFSRISHCAAEVTRSLQGLNIRLKMAGGMIASKKELYRKIQ